MISVIMSAYNETESELRESIESILGQTYADLELIIVNDNPENELIGEIIGEYAKKDDRIIVIHNEKNIGLARSLNKAIQKSSGEYIARMDADDISVSTRLEDQMDYMLSNGMDFVSGNAILIDENGDELPDEKQSPIRQTKSLGRTLLYGCIVYHPSVLVKASILRELDGYRDIVPAEDYDLWLRIYERDYKMACMGARIIKYRVRSSSISRRNQYKQHLTAQYVLSLYKQRIETGEKDDFTPESFQNYLTKHGLNNPNKNETYQRAKHDYENLLEQLKSKNMIGFARAVVCAVWNSPLTVKMFINSVKMRLAVK